MRKALVAIPAMATSLMLAPAAWAQATGGTGSSGVDLAPMGQSIADGLGQGIGLMLTVAPTAVIFALLPAIAKKALRMVA